MVNIYVKKAASCKQGAIASFSRVCRLITREDWVNIGSLRIFYNINCLFNPCLKIKFFKHLLINNYQLGSTLVNNFGQILLSIVNNENI